MFNRFTSGYGVRYLFHRYAGVLEQRIIRGTYIHAPWARAEIPRYQRRSWGMRVGTTTLVSGGLPGLKLPGPVLFPGLPCVMRRMNSNALVCPYMASVVGLEPDDPRPDVTPVVGTISPQLNTSISRY